MDETVAQAAVDQAAGWVRGVSGQAFDLIENDVVELEGGDRVLTLPQRPVVVDSTHSLTVDALALSGAATPMVEGEAWYRQGQRLIRPPASRYTAGWSQRFAGGGPLEPLACPGVWPPRVRVTYSHGFQTADDVPAVLTAIVLDVATVLASNPQGLRAEQVGGITLTYATESLQAPEAIAGSIAKKLAAVGLMPGGGAFSIRCY
jgi:hypothetical protein